MGQALYIPEGLGKAKGMWGGRVKRLSGNNSDDLSAVLSFFFCVPKRRNKKRAPQPVLALRASLTSRRGRDAEKLGLRPQTVSASFPAPVCEARQDKWGISHWHAAEHRRNCRKGRLHCLSAASLQRPGSFEEHRASLHRRGKRHRVPFLWFVSLGKQRNEHTNSISLLNPSKV